MEKTKYKITYIGANETQLSQIETDYADQYLTEGYWTRPFPNTPEESSAFGLEESLAQSDLAIVFFEEELIAIRIEKLC